MNRKLLWFGLLGGAVAWTAHLIFAYVIAEFGCHSGLSDREYLQISMVAWLEIALTLAMTMAAMVATIVAYRNCGGRRSLGLEENRQFAAERYIARAGFITSGMFAFIIVFESIPILYYLQSC